MAILIACAETMPQQCKYYEICGLPFYGNYNEDYCILHHPKSDAQRGEFRVALKGYLERGKSDFRHVTFPERADFEGHTFSSLTDFSEAVFREGLNLKGAHLLQGLNLETDSISGIDLSEATIDGPVNLVVKGTIHDLALRGAKLSGPFQFSAKTVVNIAATEARFFDTTDIQLEDGLQALLLDSAILTNGFRIKTPSLYSVNFVKAEFSGNSVIETGTISAVQASNAKFQGDIKIQSTVEIGTLNLFGASLDGNVIIEGCVHSTSLAGATIRNELRIERSEIRTQNFLSGTKFASAAELYLGGTLFHGDQEIIGRPPPKSIDLNGSRFSQKLTIHSELGARRIDVVSDKNRPELGRKASFVNVDLSRFMLLGNFIDEIEINNVRWARRWGRNILYDEVVLRKQGGDPPWGNLKEAYQILKEKYSKLGDHAVAGDFHYGEMEAKRREYGWPKRVFCPEFLYWASSGYGIGYIRAFASLLFLLVGAAILYYYFGGLPLKGDFQKSLLFSFQTGALLRPTRPGDFSTAGEWIQVAESILVPIQAALFILALRMRLKR